MIRFSDQVDAIRMANDTGFGGLSSRAYDVSAQSLRSKTHEGEYLCIGIELRLKVPMASRS